MKQYNTGFSLIEILVGILIVSMVMTAGFQALSAIGIGKIKLIEQTQVEKQAYFAAEKFFEMIKKGGTIDYEEYWNRSSYNTGYTAGHFTAQSGFGNFGDNRPSAGNTTYGRKPYYCLSKNTLVMGTGGCLTDFNVRFDGTNPNEDKGGPQRYTQYSEQFIDRNSDEDSDGGDENSDGSIIDDDDDLHIGIGPEVFPSGVDVGELYLINKEGNERTYFRWNVGDDLDAPSGSSCDPIIVGEKSMTGTGCLGTIEFLKLVGEDYGYDHTLTGVPDTDGSQGDGIIDTWLIHPDFLTSAGDVIADASAISYWQAIFPNSIHVSNVEFYLFPNKNGVDSWRDPNVALQVSPYLQLKMTLQPSWKEKRKIRGSVPTVDIATTIQLLDLDFR